MATSERREEERQCADRDSLVQRRPACSSDRCRNSDEEGVHRLDLAMHDVRDDTRRRGDTDRRERGRGRRTHLPAAHEEQQRHDHDSAADAEERAEEAGDETDQDQAHRPMLRGWLRRPRWSTNC